MMEVPIDTKYMIKPSVSGGYNLSRIENKEYKYLANYSTLWSAKRAVRHLSGKVYYYDAKGLETL